MIIVSFLFLHGCLAISEYNFSHWFDLYERKTSLERVNRLEPCESKTAMKRSINIQME